MRHAPSVLVLGTTILPLALLSGCTSRPSASPAGTPLSLSGHVHGGQQPVAGSTIQLYTVGTSADGSAATPLLSSTVTTDANGNFHLTGLYNCTGATQVYVTATGGQPLSGQTNAALAMMTALGPCTSLTASTFITINELSTAAAVFQLAGYMSGAGNVGADPRTTLYLTEGMTTAAQMVDTASGLSPGSTLPAGDTAPTALLNTLADILAACINSAGGVAGDGSACGQLFALTPDVNGAYPTNTLNAMLNLALEPRRNVAQLFALVSPAGPFEPTLTSAPADFTPTVQTPNALTVTPTAMLFPAVPVGSTSATTFPIFIKNNTSVAIGRGTGAGGGNSTAPIEFHLSPYTCPNTMNPGEWCGYDVEFTPQAKGVRTLVIEVTSSVNSVHTHSTVHLQGTGL